MRTPPVQFLTVIIAIVFIAAISFASSYGYHAPAVAPTGSNTDSPITISVTDQVKDGGLSVNSFYATGTALLKDQAIFEGEVYGNTDTPSTLHFGDATHRVALNLNGGEQSAALQSDTVQSTGGLKKLCTSAITPGLIVICADQGGGGGGDIGTVTMLWQTLVTNSAITNTETGATFVFIDNQTRYDIPAGPYTVSGVCSKYTPDYAPATFILPPDGKQTVSITCNQ